MFIIDRKIQKHQLVLFHFTLGTFINYIQFASPISHLRAGIPDKEYSHIIFS